VKEFETAFVVTQDIAKLLLEEYWDGAPGVTIEDYYIDKDHRVRDSKNSIILTHKQGDKRDGVRDEDEIAVGNSKTRQKVREFFKSTAKLTIRKARYKLKSKGISNKIVLDMVESPLRIAVIEFEFSGEENLTKARKIIKEAQARECPLSTWSYHRRRIGIAGGPSSGKTSVAKAISLELNHEFGSNSSDVVEYATSFIQKMGRHPTFADQLLVWVKQYERELAVATTANIVLSDCPVFLPYIYALRAMRDLEWTQQTDFALSSIYKRSLRALEEYDQIFVLNLLWYRENNIRYHDREQSEEITEEIKKFLKDHGRNFSTYVCTDIPKILTDILYLTDLDKIQALIRGLYVEDSSN